MKKIICAVIACAMVTVMAVGFSGCGCNKKVNKSGSNQPGYVVPTTEPELKSNSFGFFIINKEELMISKYFGSGGDVVIPDTFDNYKVTVIGHSVFSGKDVKSVTVPDTVTEIQDYAFASNNELTDVKLSANLKVIGTNAFFNCKSLQTIELPASLKSVGAFAFTGAGLTSVTIPESQTFNKLDEYVFYQCKNLKEVTLPVTMTTIADNAFEQCDPAVTFNVTSGSYGLSYAKSHNYNYKEQARAPKAAN